MTDEMIQQVPQQRGNYAVPGLIGGAIVGGAAGAAGAHYKNWGITTKPELDKVFAQTPDTFKKQIEKGGENKGAWETAQEWANKIKDANSEYDKKEAAIKEANTVVLDKEVDAKLKEAQTKYNTALEAEKSKLSKTNVKGAFVFPTADTVSKLEGIKLEDANEYKKLLDAYNKAFEKEVDYKKADGLAKTIETEFAKIDKISKAKYTLAANRNKDINKEVKVVEDKIKDLMPEITTPTRAVADIEKDIAALDPKSATYAKDVKPLRAEWSAAKRVESELKKAGKDYKVGTKNYVRFVNGLNNAIQEKRQTVLSEILGEKTQITINGKKVNTYENVVKYTELQSKYDSKIASIDARKEVKAIGGTKKLKTVAEYNADLGVAHKASPVDKKEIARLEKLRNAAIELQKSKDRLTAGRKAFSVDFPIVQSLRTKAENIARNSRNVGSALSELQTFCKKNGKINDIAFNSAEEKVLTAEEIAAKAVENLKDQQVAKDLETLKAQAKEKGTELTEQGKKLLEELGSRDSYTAKVKEDAKKAVEPLLEKLKLANKTYTGLAAAAVIGLAGALIGASSKKD